MDSETAAEKFEHAELIETDIEVLRKKFRSMRKARRLSQQDVAKLLNVSQASISSFEQATYPSMRKRTLNGVLKLVQFWERDADKVVEGDFAHRKIVAIPDHHEVNAPVPSECPQCHERIPKLDIPTRFCPFCGEALGLVCLCGNVTVDPRANFCCVCGRCLVDGEGIREYALLRNDSERFRVAVLRRFLKSLEEK